MGQTLRKRPAVLQATNQKSNKEAGIQVAIIPASLVPRFPISLP
jgi:hypothetical protein